MLTCCLPCLREALVSEASAGTSTTCLCVHRYPAGLGIVELGDSFIKGGSTARGPGCGRFLFPQDVHYATTLCAASPSKKSGMNRRSRVGLSLWRTQGSKFGSKSRGTTTKSDMSSSTTCGTSAQEENGNKEEQERLHVARATAPSRSRELRHLTRCSGNNRPAASLACRISSRRTVTHPSNPPTPTRGPSPTLPYPIAHFPTPTSPFNPHAHSSDD